MENRQSEYSFYTAYKGGRPVRLSEETRKFCFESLKGRYGDEAMETPFLTIDPSFEPSGEPAFYDVYDEAVRLICEKAPLRLCDEELVSGAATLGAAIWAQVPVKYRDNFVCPSINHLTVNFHRAVKCGVLSYVPEIMEKMRDPELTPRQQRHLKSLLEVIKSLKIYHKRYLDLVREKRPDIYNNLKNVPLRGAFSFREAVQSLWFLFSFTRLTGNWPGIGRIDLILGDYYERDLARGVITEEEARELLASFFIKGCEWVRGVDAPRGSGDAQHYQNIVIGGTDDEGRDVTNGVTYLILDVVEELPIGDFPITVRFNKKSPEKLYQRVAEVIRHGGGTVACYNEETILESLVKFGYAPREAAKFANDGCWEVQIPGCTRFSYLPFDGLGILLHDTLKIGSGEIPAFGSYEEVAAKYLEDLHAACRRLADSLLDSCLENRAGKGTDAEFWPQPFGTSVIDLFEDGCIENAKGYLEGGTRYSVVPLHIGGVPDVANSLFAIKKLCFEEKKVSLSDLLEILGQNWEGEEVLRTYVRSKYVYYGNDNPEVDSIAAKIYDTFADFCAEYGRKYKLFIPSGVSTFGRQLEWLGSRTATPFGTLKGEILSGNASPTPGTDREGATAVIKSYCAADLTKQTTGSALDVKLFPGTVSGPNGVEGIVALIKGFMNLGGFFMQLDVTDAQVLREAQKDPAKYKSLSVRVSGWNARFVSLDEHWQEMIIERNER